MTCGLLRHALEQAGEDHNMSDQKYRHPECRDVPGRLQMRYSLRLALPHEVKHWSLTTLRENLVKIGAKVTRHAKYVTFQLAEVAITRKLFAAILDRIERLAYPPPAVNGG